MTQISLAPNRFARELLESQETCPPGYYKHNEAESSAITIALASVSGALFLAGLGVCVLGACRKGDIGKKIIPACLGSVMVLASVALGIATGINALDNTIHTDGECLKIQPPISINT